MATDLIAGWWHTDRLFCLAVGFLTVLFAGSTAAYAHPVLFRRLEDAVEHKAAREAAEEAAARAEAGLLARARHPGSEAE